MSKTPVVGFRAKPVLLERLKSDAAANGYSLSEAIERRLEGSFRDDDILAVIREEMRQKPYVCDEDYMPTMPDQPGYQTTDMGWVKWGPLPK